MKILSLLLLITTISFNASAGIIGMLVEDDKTQVELVNISEDNYLVQIAITSPYAIETLFISPYLGGEGGDPKKVLEALAKNELPPLPEIAEWMTEDAGRPTAKAGLFTSNEKFLLTSVYTGEPIEVPHAKAPRLSVETLADGRLKQIFQFRFPSVVTLQNWRRLSAREIDLTLVTQILTGFDTGFKRSVELSAEKLFLTDDLYMVRAKAEIAQRRCEGLLSEEELKYLDKK